MISKLLPHLFLILLAWLIYNYEIIRFSKEKSNETEQVINHLIKMKYKVQGEECLNDEKTCFKIVDSYFIEDGEFVAKRDLLLAEFVEYSLTGVEIAPLKPLSWEISDSREWPVNKLVINSRYARCLVAAGFFMRSLSFNEKEEQVILIGGLGGGVISNFLSQISYFNLKTTVVEREKRVIDIAENYFDHFENDDLKVVEDDFGKYLDKALADQIVFDFIIVDVCENRLADVICPIEDFHKRDGAQKLSNVLKDVGTVAINIFIRNNIKQVEEKLLGVYSDVFKSCFYLNYITNRKILICTKRSNWTLEKRRKSIKSDLFQIDDMLDFKLANVLLASD